MECQVLCQYKANTHFSLKATEKRRLQPKTRHERQRKSNAIFVKEAHIENAALAIGTFSGNMHVLH